MPKKRAGEHDYDMPKTPEERFAIIETEITYIKESVLRMEANLRQITDNHLAHLDSKIDTIKTESNVRAVNIENSVRSMREFCTKVQEGKKHSLGGKDKALIIGAFVTASAAIVIEILKHI